MFKDLESKKLRDKDQEVWQPLHPILNIFWLIFHLLLSLV